MDNVLLGRRSYMNLGQQDAIIWDMPFLFLLWPWGDDFQLKGKA